MPNVAVIDLDLYKYTAAAAGEKRSVIVTHKSSGKSIVVGTRTEFYGHYLNKNGGKLAEINKKRTSPYMWDEFEYEDVQTPEPINYVLHTAKVMVEKDLEQSGADKYIAFLGEGDSFRLNRSTILKYKGNRDNQLIPLYTGEVMDYLKKKYKATTVSGIEADDKCVIESYNRPERFVLGEDKDFWGCPINFWDRNQPERGIVDCNKFGKLFRAEKTKGKVLGEGRLFLYWQVAGLDASDNYAANSASDIKWGEVAAYKALVDCKNDKEALEVLIGVYKHLYPEPKDVIGWRGTRIEGVDWLYMLQENFDLARMLRWEGDEVFLVDVFDKLGIDADEVAPIL